MSLLIDRRELPDIPVGQGVVMFVQIFRDGYLVNRPTLWAISVGLFLPMLVINIWCIKYFGRIDMVCVAAQVLGITSILIVRLSFLPFR